MEETMKQKKKQRHIVTWNQEEDDILRKQINLHGTENWTIIASNFTDKSTRQCRRRWYTYLNSDFKRGGWSAEEDTLLCETQRLFGNKWTEIAKVVSGRTDNAVKNRFTTLCKKRAKAKKENMISSCENSESESPPLDKKIKRNHIPITTEIMRYCDRSHVKVDSGMNQQIRPPFSVLPHNATTMEKNQTGDDKGNQEAFLKKDDPKVMQQSELLSSLTKKVNTDNTEQSIENAWKVLQDFLNKSKENDIVRYGISDMSFQLEEFKDLIRDSQASLRQPDLHDSPASSEDSSRSTLMPYPSGDKLLEVKGTVSEVEHDVLKNPNKIVSEEFNSPVQVTQLFRSLAAGIPSPQFSESEKNFLLKTLGVESPSPYPSVNPSQPPPCKRVLLDSL